MVSHHLKSCVEVLSPSIVALFNKSLSRGEIPDAWREAIVIPIHKKSSKSDPKNYRPVSLTSSVCKLLENIVRQHLQTHLNKHNLLIDNQHGFRSKRSCETKLISTLNDWCKALGNKQNIEIIYLDIYVSHIIVYLQNCIILELKVICLDGFAHS